MPRVSDPILRVENLVKHFPIREGVFNTEVGAVQAVDDVSFEVAPGETLGLVGESGCGKSTTGKVILRLLDPTSGKIYFDGRDITNLSRREMRPIRKEMQIIFQDPYASLNPRMTVEEIVAEPLRIAGSSKRKAANRVVDLLELVGLDPGRRHRYPKEFSGGQRQRIGVARALALDPKVLILDEPVSALDVSIQAQVINLLTDLQKELGLAYVFIAHDLAVVRHISDRVAVMYLGRIVETADKDDIYRRPTHPYTQGLLSAIPVTDPSLRGRRKRVVVTGDVPNPANPPSGCRFRTRCYKARPECAETDPVLEPHGAEGQLSACLYPEPLAVLDSVGRSDS
jgi:peptide/nickel transport system ATP-binding protein/oligopeptide transport system ATP-binding protein